MIVLTTGRKECMRAETEEMLKQLGLFFDYLLMGLPRGCRVVINDMKPGSTEPMADAVSIPRNLGLVGVDV